MMKYYFLAFSIITLCSFVKTFNLDLDVEKVTDLFMDYIDETLKASFAQVCLIDAKFHCKKTFIVGFELEKKKVS